MTTTTINSSPTILAQAKAFLNTPVAKKTAVAVASLAAAAAVASVTYNNFFQNTSNSPQTDLMFTEAFPDVMNTATQCFNTTLISNFANSNIPQNVNGTNYCDLTPPQTFIDITKNVNPNALTNNNVFQNVSNSAQLTLPQAPANVSSVELMFPLTFDNISNTGAQCLNTTTRNSFQALNQNLNVNDVVKTAEQVNGTSSTLSNSLNVSTLPKTVSQNVTNGSFITAPMNPTRTRSILSETKPFLSSFSEKKINALFDKKSIKVKSKKPLIFIDPPQGLDKYIGQAKKLGSSLLDTAVVVAGHTKNLGSSAFDAASVIAGHAKDLGLSTVAKASNAISDLAQKVSDALTEVRNFGHETIFPRF